jgi:uncharacterized circularly permuted ATP-grasp superfamily protein/uncharacterized alpha-E superfamily protein
MISELLQIPAPGPAVYNEPSPDGVSPRPHWAPFFDTLGEVGPEEFVRRWNRAERRIRENGITYNIYSDPLGAARPWKIDAIPLLIPQEEWSYIEAGIIQRAELLNLLLKDLYGPRTVLSGGLLPAALLFGNPAYLRPLAGVRVPDASYLHLLAVDLARSPDGQWWVVADRTQAPSGAGYALENRTIVSDVLPDLFRTCNVRRLASFFRAQREALLRLSGVDNPRAVLLTPGPYNETYFEHSYLSRYLGLTLVEGADLTVRDRRVFLKTVEGLQPVDVILRRVDDWFCDPLELRGDSVLGVAGLVDAICSGNVKVANALGSGAIETAAIMPFLPALSKDLLGEPLKLPCVATWWCGQDYALKSVLDHLDRLVVKPAFPLRGMEPRFGADLALSEKQLLAEQLKAHPGQFVAQEQVALSTVPVWEHDGVSSRSLVLRAYVLNTGESWVAMPGGLVRVAGPDSPLVSMQQGGHSKDAWVLSDAPVDTFSMLRPRHQPVEVRRVGADVPSRVADNLFWLGRYAERAECMTRLLRCSINHVRSANEAELECLMRLYACFDSRYSTLPKGTPATSLHLENELISLMTNSKRPDSLMSVLSDIHETGNRVRERLSNDMIRLLGQLAESVKVEEYMLFVEHSALLTGCLELLAAFSGLERENVTRGTGWLFLSLGRRLERAIYASRQLSGLSGSLDRENWPLLNYLLEVSDSSMTYRSRYFTTLQTVPVLDVLMADETNPRSLDFQLSHLADLYEKLPRHAEGDLRAIRHAVSLIRSFDLEALNVPSPGSGSEHSGNSEERERLGRSLQELTRLLASWSDNLAAHYFDHARTVAISIGG